MENDSVQSYRDLIVWQKSVEVVVAVYQLTSGFPKEEMYGLVSQMRRAAVSIPANIAEGRARGTRKDFRQFVITAFASGAELETHLVIAGKLKYATDDQTQSVSTQLSEVMKMLNKMISSLQNL